MSRESRGDSEWTNGDSREDRDSEKMSDTADRLDGFGEESEPMADLALAVGERRRERGDRADAEEFSGAFTEVDVREVGRDELWEELRDEGTEMDGTPVAVAPPEDSADDRDVRTIPKSTCRGCQFFGDPPDLHCTHDGTEIVEMVDTEQFRVADCPMVVADEDVLDDEE